MGQHKEMMEALGMELDERFNGGAEEKADEERTNFVLLAFPNKEGRYTVEVISNAGAGVEVVDLLREVVVGFDLAMDLATGGVDGHG